MKEERKGNRKDRNKKGIQKENKAGYTATKVACWRESSNATITRKYRGLKYP